MLIDSHCHLDRLDLAACGGSVDAALDHARGQGVSGFLSVGISLGELPAMLAITERHDDVYASAGLHPLEPIPDEPDHSALLAWARDERIIAVGETGLDYHYALETAAQQRRSFRMHMDVAREVGKPVIVHTREAVDDTLAVLDEYAGEVRGVLHCFTETRAMAEHALALGYYISFSGIVTFKNAAALREVAATVPADRLLVETDSPYLAPVPHRGKPNQPAYVRQVAEQLAALRGESLEQLAAATTANFRSLFAVT